MQPFLRQASVVRDALRHCAPFGVVLLLAASQAEARNEMGRTSLLGNDIILYDDNTWAFADPNVGTPVGLLGDDCLGTSEGRLEFCPPALWPDRAATFSEHGVELWLTGGESGHVLSVYLDEQYGHEGDFELYENLGPAEGLFITMLSRAVGLQDFEEFSVIQDEVVLVNYTTVDAGSGFTTVSVQLMTENTSVWMDLTTQMVLDGQGVAFAQHDTGLVEVVWGALSVDGTPLPQWIEMAEGK